MCQNSNPYHKWLSFIFGDFIFCFQTPKGVYCAGRKATKPVPKVPTHFSYRIEANLISFNQTTAHTEWYDFENQLARFDYTPLGDVDKLTRGKHKISEVHDYKGGLRYIIDTKLEKCLNVTTLDPYSVDANIANSSNYVRIRTALEMFHFDKVDYQYHGSRKVRDIDCDIWIAKRDDWPPQPGLNTTSYWEWSFMSNSWSAINSGEPQYNIPIQLTITKFVMFGPFYVRTYSFLVYLRVQGWVISFESNWKTIKLIALLKYLDQTFWVLVWE